MLTRFASSLANDTYHMLNRNIDKAYKNLSGSTIMGCDFFLGKVYKKYLGIMKPK